MERDARQVARALDRAIRGKDGVGVGRFAEASGIPKRTIENHCEGVNPPNLEQFLVYVRALRELAPEKAATLLDEVFGIVGFQARPAPQVCPEASPTALTLRVPAAVGDVMAWADDALADGTIDPYEASEGEKRIRHARHRLDELDAAVGGAAGRTPQLALGATP